MAAGESYEEFVEKFKPKKTTDDCYTPPSIYAVIRDWSCKEYGIDPAKIVRPFYPGGKPKRKCSGLDWISRWKPTEKRMERIKAWRDKP